MQRTIFFSYLKNFIGACVFFLELLLEILFNIVPLSYRFP
jgi:hypothetical protein